MPIFYTKSGVVVKNPEAYAETGAPMFDYKGNNINKLHTIYKVNCENGKKYIGKTTDIERRIYQHATGNGAKVTQKFKPKTYEIVTGAGATVIGFVGLSRHGSAIPGVKY